MPPTSEILEAASLALARTLDLDSVLETLLDSLAQLVPYDSASVMLVEDGSRLSLRALRGYEPWTDPAQTRAITFDAGTNSILAEILRAQRSLLIPDTSQHPGWERRPGAEHVFCWLGVPLSAGGSVIGLYSLDKAQAGVFTEEHRRLAENLAPHAALAIQNARLYARERATREEAERLQAATRALSATLDLQQVFALILRELQALIPYDSASVMELKDQRMEIIGGHGFANLSDLLGVSFDLTADNANREVVRSRAPVIVDDAPARYPAFRSGPHAPARIRSWLGVPLLFGDRLLGMLALDKGQPGFFTTEHARLAATFAAQAAIAVENARLYAAARWELGERRRAEARYQAFVEQAPYGVVAVNQVGQIVLVNAEAERLFGYGRAEVLDRPLDVLVPERFREKHRGHRAGFTTATGVRPMGAGLDLYGLRKDGTEFPVDVSLGPLETEEGSLVVAAVRDVSERKRAEEALRRSEERFEKAFQASPAAMSISTWSEGRLLDVNERFLAITGYRREEAVGRTLAELSWWESPEEAAEVVRALDERGAVRDRAFRYRTKGGDLRDGVGSFELIEVPEGPCVLGLAEDVTERRLLEAQLRQAQKMEAVGRLAGGIAHDFNNLLTVVLGHSDLLLKRAGGDPSLGRGVEEIKKASERAASLTRQLLAFGRRQVLQPKVLDLAAVVANVQSMLHRLIGEDVALVTVASPGLGRVRADPGQIDQVLVNLAVNARDAMPLGGTLTIETSNADLDAEYVERHLAIGPGRYVLLAVSDTGCGMDTETQSRIFEPFFTTKPEGRGTGLGLSTVYGIVKQSDGYIWVYSEPGRGTTFKIYLPRVDQEATAVEPGEATVEAPRGTETVLLVEDQEMVRDMVREALEMSGYAVLAASGGADALALAAGHRGPIHLLVTDVVMPGMSGRELAERLSTVRPTLRVLFMSGYTDDAISRHGILEEGVTFLQKPFTPDALSRKVRELLDRG